jgi:hypothetical protein
MATRLHAPLAFVLTLLLAGAALAKNPVDDGGVSGKALTLRLNPAIGAPGGMVAVVLRTYAPRPIKQGQVVVRAAVRKPGTAAGTFGHRPGRGEAERSGLTAKSLTQPVRPLTLVKVVVNSQLNDAVSKAVLNNLVDAQTTQVNFQSASSTINSADGPLAVFYYRLDPSVAPGDAYDLTLDLTQTKLTDPNGKTITIDPRANTLTVRAPGDPFQVEAGGGTALAGGLAEVAFNTFEPFAVSGGRVTLTWDPAIAGGPPVVTLDPRYGQATFTVDSSQPGRLVVDFQSPDASYNGVPGSIIDVSLPIAADAVPGTSSPLTLDPEETWLLDPQGNKIGLALENGTIQVQ